MLPGRGLTVRRVSFDSEPTPVISALLLVLGFLRFPEVDLSLFIRAILRGIIFSFSVSPIFFVGVEAVLPLLCNFPPAVNPSY